MGVCAGFHSLGNTDGNRQKQCRGRFLAGYSASTIPERGEMRRDIKNILSEFFVHHVFSKCSIDSAHGKEPSFFRDNSFPIYGYIY